MRQVKEVGKFIHNATSLWGRAPAYITRLLRYSSASLFAVAIDILILFILVELFTVFYLIAALFAFAVAHSFNYLINWNWVFKGTHWRPYKCFVYFFSFGIIGAILTVILLLILVGLFSMHYLPAKLIAAVIVGVVNFTLNYKYTFRVDYELPKIFSGSRK